MHSQMTTEGAYLHSETNVEVNYRFRHAIDDRRHLVVVLSGFRDPIHSVDFNAASKDITANILWIYDEFDGMPGYYYWGKKLKDLSAPVHSTIMEIAAQLGLTQENVTVFGLSKGANAALLFAAEYGYSKVVASAPRAFNGTSMRTYHNDVFSHIVDDSDSSEVEAFLNEALTKAVRKNRDLSKSIFVATSPADTLRYHNESTEISSLFKYYENFHIVHSVSPLVRNHIDVSRYNLPLYKSLLTQFSEGFIPSLKGSEIRDDEFLRQGGTLENSIGNGLHHVEANENPLPRSTLTKYLSRTLRAKVDKVALSETSVLDFKGYAILNGIPSDRHGLAKMRISLTSQLTESREIWFPIATVKDDSLTGKLFDTFPVDYSCGAVTTQQEKGIRMSQIPFGRYVVGVEVSRASETSKLDSIGAPRHNRWIASRDRLVGTLSDGHKWEICSLPPRGRDISDCFFDLKKIENDGNLLFIEGYFIPYGMDVKEWDDVKYYLLLESTDPARDSTNTRIFQLSNGRKANANRLSGETWRDQSKAYFTTKGYAGLELEDILPGKYKMAITGRCGDDVFTRDLDWILDVSIPKSDGLDFPPKVALVGSCVTRDNFNSGISPRWKEYWELGDVFYQSSIISLMSQPVNFTEEAFQDLDVHSRRTTEEDFSKKFIDGIMFQPPGYLIVDLYADARFGVISTGSSWVTHNEWKLTRSAAYDPVRLNRVLSTRSYPGEFYQLFKEKCHQLKCLLGNECPDTIVCLNVTRNVDMHRGLNAAGGKFSKDTIAEVNSAWEQLEEIFIDVLDPTVVYTLDDDVKGDSKHVWGSGPVHYEAEYYQRFHGKLRSALKLPSEYSLKRI